MVHEFVNDTYRVTNLKDESSAYLEKREELRLAEIELMEHQERVAALRRELPQGEALQDYEFVESPTNLKTVDEPRRSVKLSELFTAAGSQLVIYHLMYGKKQAKPCPMCTMWIDGLNGIAPHIAQTIDFAVVAAPRSRACAGLEHRPLAQRGFEYFQIRSGQRGRRRRPRLDRICLYQGQRRLREALLHSTSENGT